MKSKKKRGNGRLFAILLIAVLLAAGVYAEVRYNLISGAFSQSQKRLTPEGITFEYEREANPVFSRGSDGFLCVTGDGATKFSFKGEKQWNVTFTMQSPFVLKSGEYWAILEPKGRAVYVCGQDGLLYPVSAEYPILNASLTRIGCLALVLEAGEGYKIRIYNSEGEATMTRESEIDGVYPVCASLTDDGYIYGISSLDTTKTTLVSILQYFYTDSGAQRYGTDTQTPFKAIEKPNTVITKIIFSPNGNLTALSDNEIFITTARGEELFSYELQNQLKSYSFGEEAFGFVTGKPLSSLPDKTPEGIAEWFDYSGKSLAEFPAEESEGRGDMEWIDIQNNVLLKSVDGYILTDMDGRQIWTYGAPEDILAIIPIDKRSAIIAKNGSAEVYTLKKPKKGGDNL